MWFILEIESQLPEIKSISVGLLHLLLQHTSAGLTLNENCDPDVRTDLNNVLNKLIPEGNFYIHADEGPDDMPAHVKSSLMGSSLTLPISQGRLALG
jgi:secondary thiamine-phosphate synthase enzyme